MTKNTPSPAASPRPAPDDFQKNEVLRTSQDTTVELIDANGRYVRFTLSHDAIIDLVNELLTHSNIAEHIEP